MSAVPEAASTPVLGSDSGRSHAPSRDGGGGKRRGHPTLRPVDANVKQSTRILIVDDHPIAREGLKRIVSSHRDMRVVGEAANSSEGMSLARQGQWDVVVLDLAIPGRSGVELLKDLKSEMPDLPILVLSVHPEDQLALRLLKAGASGYLTKDAAPEELVEAIRKIVAGGKYISPALAEKLAFGIALAPERPLTDILSDREYQVFREIAAGKSVSEIARELSLSVKTISTLRSRVMAKLKLRNTAELIRFAIERNLFG